MPEPVGELIVDVPAPGGDECEGETSTILEPNVIKTWVVRAYLDGDVGEVEFYRPHAAGFEVDEDELGCGGQEVAWVWLSVQQLIGAGTAFYGFACTVKRAQEKVTVAVVERGTLASVRDDILCRGRAFHEVGCFDLDVAHGCVEPLECVSVLHWLGGLRRRLVVGPEGDGEAVGVVHARLDPRIERCDRATGCGQTPGDPDLKRGDVVPGRCYSSEHVAWQQTQREGIRVLDHDGVVDLKVHIAGDEARCGDRT